MINNAGVKVLLFRAIFLMKDYWKCVKAKYSSVLNFNHDLSQLWSDIIETVKDKTQSVEATQH